MSDRNPILDITTSIYSGTSVSKKVVDDTSSILMFLSNDFIDNCIRQVRDLFGSSIEDYNVSHFKRVLSNPYIYGSATINAVQQRSYDKTGLKCTYAKAISLAKHMYSKDRKVDVYSPGDKSSTTFSGRTGFIVVDGKYMVKDELIVGFMIKVISNYSIPVLITSRERASITDDTIVYNAFKDRSQISECLSFLLDNRANDTSIDLTSILRDLRFFKDYPRSDSVMQDIERVLVSSRT